MRSINFFMFFGFLVLAGRSVDRLGDGGKLGFFFNMVALIDLSSGTQKIRSINNTDIF